MKTYATGDKGWTMDTFLAMGKTVARRFFEKNIHAVRGSPEVRITALHLSRNNILTSRCEAIRMTCTDAVAERYRADTVQNCRYRSPFPTLKHHVYAHL